MMDSKELRTMLWSHEQGLDREYTGSTVSQRGEGDLMYMEFKNKYF